MSQLFLGLLKRQSLGKVPGSLTFLSSWRCGDASSVDLPRAWRPHCLGIRCQCMWSVKKTNKLEISAKNILHTSNIFLRGPDFPCELRKHPMNLNLWVEVLTCARTLTGIISGKETKDGDRGWNTAQGELPLKIWMYGRCMGDEDTKHIN